MVVPTVSVKIDVPAVLNVCAVGSSMISVELLFDLELVSALAGHVHGGEAATEFASASTLASARALQGNKALMMGGIIKARQSIYGVI